MSNLNRHPVRRAAVGVLAGTLAFSGAAIGVGVSPANALPGFDFDRLSGNDRYGTAAEIAVTTFQDADTAVLASGATRNFPDALTGNYLAGEVQGPILLTAPDDLPQVTIEALDALNTDNVFIVGETAAVSASVENELEGLGYNVERIGGADRYATAEEVARAVAGDNAGTSTSVGESNNGQRTAILGNGQNFPDILAAGPLGFAEQFPILITPNTSNDLNAGAAEVIEDLDIERVIIVGGTTAVTTGAEEDAEDLVGEGNVIRLQGTQRFQTAIAIADFAYDELGFDQSHVNLARSDDFADALAGGPHAGEERAPIVITPPTTLHPATEAFLNARACTLIDGHIFGGFAAISPEVAEQAEDAAASNENCPAQPLPDTLDVQPSDSATATVTANTDTTTVDNRTFTVDGLFEGETYRITLVKCENVRTDAAGNSTFLAEAATGSSTGFAAVTGNPTADITSVNGVATTDATTTAGFQSPSVTFVADGTSANFTIDGDTVECVVPVVYFDSTTANPNEGGSIPRLEVQGPAGGFGAPAEDVDVGGETNFVAPTQPTQPPAQDTTPATATVAVAIETAGSDQLRVTFDEAIQGVGTYLLRDTPTGNLIAEFEIISISSDSRTVTLRSADGTVVDFDANDGQNFVLEILNERDLAGNQTVVTVPVDETGTTAEPTAPPGDNTPASLTEVVASDTAGSDALIVTFDEPVQGVGTFLLLDENGNVIAEFTVSEGEGTDTLILVTADDVDFAAINPEFTLRVIDELDLAGNETDDSMVVDQSGAVANDENTPLADETPAELTEVVASDTAGSDTLIATFSEDVQGVGTFLLLDENGAVVAEFTVADGEGTDTLILVTDADVDFAALGPDFTLRVIDELDLAGNETDDTMLVDQSGTLAGDDEPLVITDAVVATDIADSKGATDTASTGDVFVLTFDEEVATTTGVSLTVTDVDGDEAVISCVEDAVEDAVADDDLTAATCELSEDGLTLEIELLEPVVETDDGSGNDDGLQFPVTITATENLTDVDGNAVDLAEGDTEIDSDENTVVVELA